LIVRGNPIPDPGKIMVRAPNWIGDAVMSLPALEALRARYPSAEIVVVAKPWVSEIFAGHQAVSRQIDYDSTGEHRGARGLWNLARALRDERFDAAVLFQNAFHAAWMARLAGIPVRIGYTRDARGALLTHAIEAPAPAAYGHHAYYYLQLLLRAGVIPKFEPVEEIRLTAGKAERAWARKYVESLGYSGPRLFVGVSPGASFGPAKRWPPERFADLADRLIGALGADVLIFGSAAEKPLAEAIAGEMEHTPTIVAGETSLAQLMALFAQCRLIVTNDSGPMHLAAALGVPLVAVFGSTSQRSTGPLGAHVRVVKRPPPCSPCGLRECPIDFRCMMEVTVESVHRAALEVVKEYRARAHGVEMSRE